MLHTLTFKCKLTNLAGPHFKKRKPIKPVLPTKLQAFDIPLVCSSEPDEDNRHSDA